MEKIKYKITFFSEWHTGSGLTSGSDLDALVLKDKNDMPYIPGRTLKGLLKEAAKELTALEYIDVNFIETIFGVPTDTQKNKSVEIIDLEEIEATKEGECFFGNANVTKELYNASVKNKLTPFYYRTIASTAINGDSGVAKKHSLRRMQTTIPCELEAEITNVSDDFIDQIEFCFKWMKRLGQNRNRGLGRCKFDMIKEEEETI